MILSHAIIDHRRLRIENPHTKTRSMTVV